MTGIDVLKQLIAGTAPERPLASFWGHFYKEEQQWQSLLEATVAFQKRFGWDFVKINPSSVFFVEDWGNRYVKFDDRKQEISAHRIHEIDDFLSLENPSPYRGVRGDHLKLISAMKDMLPHTPLIMTLFNPLSYARRLCGTWDSLLEFIRTEPDKVLTGLETITRSTIDYANACLEMGCHGFFYATTEWGDRNLISDDGYDRFSRPFDLRILTAVREQSLFNVLHVCKSNNRLKNLMDYPVDALSWDAREGTNPSLSLMGSMSDKVLIGGISNSLLESTAHREALDEQIGDFFAHTKGRRAIVGPGCSIDHLNLDVLSHIREHVDQCYRASIRK